MKGANEVMEEPGDPEPGGDRRGEAIEHGERRRKSKYGKTDPAERHGGYHQQDRMGGHMVHRAVK